MAAHTVLLLALAAAAAQGTFVSSRSLLQESNPKQDFEADVIVIGAGMAGAAVA
jgi:hypothetical protein